MTDEIQKRPITPEGGERKDEQDTRAKDTPQEGAVEEALDRATAPVGRDEEE